MTLFEYLAIAFGLLFTLAAMRLIGGLPSAIDPARRYWAHLLMVVALLLGTASVFWTFWSLHEIAWTFGRFLLTLGIPGVLYFMTTLLVPENPETVASWRDHFASVRARFFASFAAWGVLAAVAATVNLGLPLVHPARVFHVLVISMGVVGAVSSNRRVHEALVLMISAIGFGLAFTFAAAPGWLAR